MFEKVVLRLFFVSFHGSDEDGVEIGGRCSCEESLRHSNRNLDELVGDGKETAGERMKIVQSLGTRASEQTREAFPRVP